MLSPDGTLLFFTRTSKTKAKGDITTTRKELFTWAKRPDERLPFDSGVPLPEPFNLGTNYGGASISVDNKLMVLAANRPVPSNPANVDLFSTEYHVDYRDLGRLPCVHLVALVPLGANVNSPQGWEAQPSISGDGKTLFFAGARAESTPDKDGNLTMDIFMSTRLDNGLGVLRNNCLRPSIPRPRTKSPFLHPDGRTLVLLQQPNSPQAGLRPVDEPTRHDGHVERPHQPWTPPQFLRRRARLGGEHRRHRGHFREPPPGNAGLDLCTYPLPADLKPDPVTVVKGDLGWPVPEGRTDREHRVRPEQTC